MTAVIRKRSRSIHLLLCGTVTLVSACRSLPAFSDQVERYPSADEADPSLAAPWYSSEAECAEALGPDSCQEMVVSWPDGTIVADAVPINAVGYDEDEIDYQQYWPAQYPLGSTYSHWVGRKPQRRFVDVLRKGFGRIGLHFGGGGRS